jgi:hypothetical protein
VTLGSLSDGFWQYYAGPSGRTQLYATEITGGSATGAATLFDPAAAGAYYGLSGGLGANSATYFLTAGADTSAANPSAVTLGSTTGTLTVAGIPGGSALTNDPLYVYNYDTDNNNKNTNLSKFVDYASLVRTGTGNITISTAGDLVLQSPLSLIYTAGTGTTSMAAAVSRSAASSNVTAGCRSVPAPPTPPTRCRRRSFRPTAATSISPSAATSQAR